MEEVARALREQALRLFLDRWYVAAGRPWPQVLEGALDACTAVAVFLGPYGMGHWQQREKDLTLERQARDPSFPVIPALLLIQRSVSRAEAETQRQAILARELAAQSRLVECP